MAVSVMKDESTDGDAKDYVAMSSGPKSVEFMTLTTL
jgi:hypothetical protein